MKFSRHFFARQNETVGVALGDTHVRGLQLSGTLSAARVVGFGAVELPKTIFGSDAGVDSEGLARVLEFLFAKQQYGQFTTRDVALNLPESNCFVRVIHVAPMTDEEIDAAVPFEAESYIPIPVDQVYLDWKRLGEANGRVELLLVASGSERQIHGLVIADFNKNRGRDCTSTDDLCLYRARAQPAIDSRARVRRRDR